MLLPDGWTARGPFAPEDQLKVESCCFPCHPRDPRNNAFRLRTGTRTKRIELPLKVRLHSRTALISLFPARKPEKLVLACK